MFRSIRNTILLASAEIRATRRLERFKVIVAILSATLLVAYVVSYAILSDTAAYSPSFVASAPLYLAENIDPVFHLMFVASALLLVFDVDRRNVRNCMSEVLQSKPVSNLQWMAGRVLGCAGLLWFVAASNILLMQLLGWLAQVGRSETAGTLQVHSVIALLFLDVPAALIAWCSLAVFLQSVLRNGVLVVAGVLVAAFTSYLLQQHVPYSFLDLVSPSSNDTLFISDVIPQLPSLPSTWMRVGTLAFATSLIFCAAWKYERLDRLPSARTLSICVLGFVMAAVGSFSFAAAHTLGEIDEVAGWRNSHQGFAREDSLDVQSVSGRVRIDPASHLAIDLELDFKIRSGKPASSLTFSLNPGMNISVVELDGLSSRFSFHDGILSVPIADSRPRGAVQTLRIAAEGVPNPRFAYIDSPLDYVSMPGLPLRVVKSFGTEGSIYGREYVALMPGSHWYPSPGPLNDRFGDGDRDYFELDLLVELANPGWRLVGLGVSRLEGRDGNWYEVSPSVPLPQVGLFASEFESVQTDVHGVSLSMHLHARHARKLALPQHMRDQMADWLKEFFRDQAERGFEYLHDSLALVEVPSKLRTVGGGWRMESLNALPGVMLLKERGYPVAPTLRAVEREEDEDEHFSRLRSFFDRGLGTDNLTYTLPHHVWTHVTSASGPHAEVLDQIVLSLLRRMRSNWTRGWFSPYSTMQFARMTTPSLWLATDLWATDATSAYRANIHRQESAFAGRGSVFDLMESTPLTEIPPGWHHRKHLELVLLKGEVIANAMMSYHLGDFDRIQSWLAALREEFLGRTYRREDLIAEARKHGLTVDPFLTEWLTESALPGFVVSPGAMADLPRSDDGSRNLQLSFSVRNTEAVEGYVIPLLPGLNAPILIGANSAKRINLVWENAPAGIDSLDSFHFPLETGLSLNRWSLSVTVAVPDPIPDAQPLGVAEDSDWTPPLEGIVVDDLDEGFSVLQPNHATRRLWANGLGGWFMPQELDFQTDGPLVEMDSYSPIGRGRWARSPSPDAYGLHRRTTTIARVGNDQFVYTARFAAEIPESNRWQLEFYVHRPPLATDAWTNSFEFTDFKLRVHDGASSWDVDVDTETSDPEWRVVGAFDLSKGVVHVDVVDAPKNSWIFADAIRWTPIDKEDTGRIVNE